MKRPGIMRKPPQEPGSILFVGDTHGVFTTLNSALAKPGPEAVIVVGDFGYWRRRDFLPGSRARGFLHDKIRTLDVPVYFCDGNHENHRLLGDLVRKHGRSAPIRIRRNLFYMPRGSVLAAAGRRILFAGGAFSIDREYREKGKTWFEEEILGPEEARVIVESLESPETIDTVVSHTCPAFVSGEVCRICGIRPEWLVNTETERSLQQIYEALPAVRDWFFGHWHQQGSFEAGAAPTRFHMLNMTPLDGCMELVGN